MNTTPAGSVGGSSLDGVPRIAYADALDWMEERLGGAPWLVTIDGRSGAGKTVLADALAARHPEAQLVRLDDLYRDWDSLPSGVLRARHLAEHWRAGDSPAYRPTQWLGMPARGHVTLEAARPLVIEGVGATWAGERLAVAQVWLSLGREQRRLRALNRDGEIFAPHWITWGDQEDAWFAQYAPHPHVVVPVDDGGAVASAP